MLYLSSAAYKIQLLLCPTQAYLLVITRRGGAAVVSDDYSDGRGIALLALDGIHLGSQGQQCESVISGL